MAVKNTFAMSFKKPIPMSGTNSRAFSATKGSMGGGAIENPFLKKSVNLRESQQKMTDTRELSEDLNQVREM